MICTRAEAAESSGYYYHTIRFWESKPNWPGYPMTEEQLAAFRATMKPYRRFDLRKYKYRRGKTKRDAIMARRFGRTIERELRRLKWNRKLLALKCGVTETAVGKWIRGESKPHDPEKVREALKNG